MKNTLLRVFFSFNKKHLLIMKKITLLLLAIISFIACNERINQENDTVLFKIITEDDNKIILKQHNNKIINDIDYKNYLNFIHDNPYCGIYDNGSEYKFLYKNMQSLEQKINKLKISNQIEGVINPNPYGYFNLYSNNAIILQKSTFSGQNEQITDLSSLNINNKADAVVAFNCKVYLYKNKNFSISYNDDYPQPIGGLITNDPEKDVFYFYLIDASNGKKVNINFPLPIIPTFDSSYRNKTSSIKWEGSYFIQ